MPFIGVPWNRGRTEAESRIGGTRGRGKARVGMVFDGCAGSVRDDEKFWTRMLIAE